MFPQARRVGASGSGQNKEVTAPGGGKTSFDYLTNFSDTRPDEEKPG